MEASVVASIARTRITIVFGTNPHLPSDAVELQLSFPPDARTLQMARLDAGEGPRAARLADGPGSGPRLA